MRIPVTIKAVREFIHHYCWMRSRMAFLTFGDISVGVLMAECTLKGCVFTCSCCKQCNQITMTVTAVLVRCGFNIGNIGRLMNQMTAYTYCKVLTVTMRIMTFHTVRNIPVFVVMADCTVK